jgi:hypothetical protein
LLGHCVVVDDVCKSASFHVFHHYPEFAVLDKIRVQKVDNVAVLRFLHDHDFIDDQFLARLLGQIHLFDGDFGTGGKGGGYIDRTRGTGEEEEEVTRRERKKYAYNLPLTHSFDSFVDTVRIAPVDHGS